MMENENMNPSSMNSVENEEKIIASSYEEIVPKALLEETEVKQNSKQMSPGKMVMKRFFRSRLSMVGIGIILFLFLFSFVGPLFSPYGELDKDMSGGKTSIIAVELTYTVGDETFTQYDITFNDKQQNLMDYPSAKHWFGTDDFGYDVLTRIMYGGRISLTIGFIVVFLETIVGVIFGGIAGYCGKWVDQLIMRIVDIFYCIPTLPILLICSALIESWEIPEKQRIYYLMIILTFFGWSGTARMVRGQILMLREQEYMTAAQAMGLSPAKKIFKHLIPNVLPQLIVSMTLGLGGIILTESTLSFMGLGVPMPYAAWGSIIGRIENYEILTNHFHIWGPPGLCIMLAVLGFNFIGDGLRDAFDPKMKR